MPALFPKTPLLIEAYYLRGLDLMRDLKTESGKLIRARNLSGANEMFQEGEDAYWNAQESGSILEGDKDYFISLYFQCCMEKSATTLELAENTSDTKREVYLGYSAESYRDLVEQLKQSESHPLFNDLLEEALYKYAYVQKSQGDLDNALKTLNELETLFDKSQVTRGYYLSRMWYLRGLIAREKGKIKEALACFDNSEDAAKGNLLIADQKLDLWIQESLCYQELDDYETAMKILSKAVNEDVASAERLKAMFLRAELYFLQGRDELAIKQLDALARKGGVWGEKAKQKRALQN